MNLDLLDKFKERNLALLFDDEGHSSRACLVLPAQNVSTEQVNEILSVSAAHLYVAMNSVRAKAFALSAMGRPATSAVSDLNQEGACVSVEARSGISTGISAADRATTIRILGSDAPDPKQLVSPGHIFPLIVRDGGVLVRNALAEGALDLVSLGRLGPAALMVDLLNDKGEFCLPDEQEAIAARLKIPLFALSEIVEHRLATETLVYREAEADLPTDTAGMLRSYIYRSSVHNGEHVALVKGELSPEMPVLIRVEPESTLDDVFGASSDQKSKVAAALKKIGHSPSGILLYLRTPQRGQLKQQLNGSNASQTKKRLDNMRDYGIGAQILRDLGVKKIVMLSDNKIDFIGLKSFGIEIVEHQPLSEV